MPIDANAAARAKFRPVREKAFGDITGSMTAIGAPFSVSFGILYVQNFTDVNIDFSISYAGTDTTFTLAPSGILSTDMITNGLQVSAGESAWCKHRGVAPTSGFVQVSEVSQA
jgi:hypothetical protein